MDDAQTLCASGVIPEGFVAMSDVQSEHIEWLWYPYLPKGKTALIEGDPGVGKSWITMELAATVSKGRSFPGSDPIPSGQVVIFSAEDGPADTLAPRLAKLDADLSKIYVYPKSIEFDSKGLVLIEEALEQLKPTLLLTLFNAIWVKKIYTEPTRHVLC